jgi:hypothetical protein
MARPSTRQYGAPERWLRNLFEDGVRETLETTVLPVNVSKINDCMKRLDPTYRINESSAHLPPRRCSLCNVTGMYASMHSICNGRVPRLASAACIRACALLVLTVPDPGSS